MTSTPPLSQQSIDDSTTGPVVTLSNKRERENEIPGGLLEVHQLQSNTSSCIKEQNGNGDDDNGDGAIATHNEILTQTSVVPECTDNPDSLEENKENFKSTTSSSTLVSSLPKNKKSKKCTIPLHVEVIVHPCCPTPFSVLRKEVEKFIVNVGQTSFMYKEGPVDLTTASPLIQKSCIEVAIVDIEQPNNKNTPIPSSSSSSTTTSSQPSINTIEHSIASWNISTIHIHTYSLSNEDAEPEELETDNDNEEPITACEALPLPHETLHTSWDNLILPHPIKSNLLGYAESALIFTNAQVSTHIISWNRILLLHGPPGTGKTSLCRALAHKLSIRTQHIFPEGGYLLEIKSHSLFSKWFSESGKLVSNLFGRIREMVEEEPDRLFCVLIDEVESLAARRIGSGDGGVEPSDAVRAVNSLLTSMDKLKVFKNVIILTTTNITESVDSAFVDRVDMKQFVGLPCLEARYEILRSCVEELIRVGIVSFQEEENCKDSDEEIITLKNFQQLGQIELKDMDKKNNNEEDRAIEYSLLECAYSSDGLSGRTLRKLPFQSHAFFVRSPEATSLRTFLSALKDGIQREKNARNDFK